MELKSTVTVVDSLMGSGKTTWAINYMKEHPEENFMYITPYLDETDRIVESTKPERQFWQPKRTGKDKGKLENVGELISYGSDIASTHELFRRFDENTKYQLLSSPVSYTLIIDETLDLVTPIQIKPSDIRLCIEKGLISMDENGVCKWVYESDEYNGRFADIKEAAQTNCMICVKEKFFIWRFDPEIFTGDYFGKIIVLTYMFNGSIMKPYFEYYNINYSMASISNNRLVKYYEPNISDIAKLVNLYEGGLNESFEQKISDLSATWFKNDDNLLKIKKLKNNMDNYFRNILKASSDTMLWSIYYANDSTDKHFKSAFRDSTRYDEHFLPCNVRGTNNYSHTSNLAYMINIYVNPGIQHFFEQKGIRVNSNMYALQYMVQWIWRSRIRNGESVNIYVPSKRMRELLKCWMSNKEIPDKS